MSINTIKSGLIALVKEWERNDEAFFNIWTYLPSQEAASKHFGDYSFEQQPKKHDLLEEARLLIVLLLGGKILKSTFIHWFYCSLDIIEDVIEDEEIYEFLREWFQTKGFDLQEEREGVDIKVSLLSSHSKELIA